MRNVIKCIFRVLGTFMGTLGCIMRTICEILLSSIGSIFHMSDFKRRHTARMYEYAQKSGQWCRKCKDMFIC